MIGVMAYIPYNIYKEDYMTEFKLITYEKENGEVPVEEFLNSVKKTQKTPKEEIQIAKDRRKNFI